MQSKPLPKIAVRLPAPLLQLLRQAGRTAEQSGNSLYLVGGVVRDLLLDRGSKDIDLMTTGDATKLVDKLGAASGAKPTLHKKFGTATFVWHDYRIDLATCRSETYTRPGALPEVRPGNISDDLFRRDFTVNAMAVNLNPSHYGELVDLYGGRADLKAGLIRILHSRSFQDDATRIMRAIRYEQRLGFRLEAGTARLLREHLGMLDTISGERLRNELFLWLEEQEPEKILERAGRLGILKKLHPDLRWQYKLHIAFKRSSLLQTADKAALHFCLLTYHLDEDGLYELLQRLNLTGTRYDLLTHHSMSIKENRALLMKDSLKNSELYFMLNNLPLTAIQANLVYPNHHRMRRRLNLYLNRLSKIRLLTGGAGLTALGIKQGPAMGRILDALLTAKLDGRLKTRREEEQMALALAANETRLK